MNVFVGLDDPEANSFVRGGSWWIKKKKEEQQH